MKIIYSSGFGEVTEKKSRFVSEIYPIRTEQEAVVLINETKKKYWDARHHCYAFVCSGEREVQRCSDDGEPSGTAGKPILDIIVGEGLENCLIIVTRYFGGTLLGTGGLVRAYTMGAKSAIENARIIEGYWGTVINIGIEYSYLGKIQYFCEKSATDILHIDYSDLVKVKVIIRSEKLEEFIDRITEVTAGNALIERDKQRCFGYLDNKPVLLD